MFDTVNHANKQNIYPYHKPVKDIQYRLQAFVDTAQKMSHLIMLLCPPTQERTVALTHIQEVVKWAFAAIERNK